MKLLLQVAAAVRKDMDVRSAITLQEQCNETDVVIMVGECK